ncbi:MAG: DUF885 family protein, partial [Pseudomonadota bacterium]
MTFSIAKFLTVAVLGSALAACGGDDPGTSAPAPVEAVAPSEKAQVDPSTAFLEMAARHASAYLAEYPEGATQLGVSPEIAGADYASRLAGYGFDASEKARELNEQFAQELRSFSRDDLTGTAQATYDVLNNAYNLASRRNAFPFGGATPAGGAVPQVGAIWAVSPYLVTQLTGPHLYIPRMLQTQHAVASKSDVEAYLSRLEDFGRAFDEIIETINSDAAAGVTPPYFSIEGVIGSAQALRAPAPSEHPLVTALTGKMALLNDVDEEAQAAYAAQAIAHVENVVYPAYGRLEATMENLLPQAGTDAGVWRLGPEGEAFYQMALDAYGAGGMSGDEVHELGLSEVARITAEMDAILKGEGLTEGAVSERLAILN